MKKLLISLFDHSGNASKPYEDSVEWDVVRVDIKNGVDILTWDYESFYHNWRLTKYEPTLNLKIGQTYPAPHTGIICMVPCTDYALSGARHFARKDSDGSAAQSQLLVAKSKEILDYFQDYTNLDFWQLENPMSRIHTLNPWLRSPLLKFNPCDFAGYSPEPEKDRYNKATWLWGKFNIPEKKRLEPHYKENPGWKILGGKSERVKELRSITPQGFCQAFYEFNH